MKLIIAIVNRGDEKKLVEDLSKNNFSATKTKGQGTFLGKFNSVFLIGTEEEKVKQVTEIVKNCCESKKENIAPAPQTMEPGELVIPEAEKITTSGAIIFVLEVSQFLKL